MKNKTDNPSPFINCGQMVRMYLERNGYEGLCGDECGCELADLMPCGGEYAMDCVGGHKTDCTCDDGCDNLYSNQICRFHITAGKRPALDNK